MRHVLKYITKHKLKFSRFSNILLILLLFFSGFVLVLNFQHPSSGTLKPLPQDSAVQVYFNYNQAASYQDPYRHFTRKGDN